MGPSHRAKLPANVNSELDQKSCMTASAIIKYCEDECTTSPVTRLNEGLIHYIQLICGYPSDILQAQCQVFATTYNPEGVRMGNKVLRQRLKGPALAAYYPRKVATIKDVKREFGPVLATWDEAEEDRFEYIEEYAARTTQTLNVTTTILTYNV